MTLVQQIGTLDRLRTHLQWAIELEHATIPPYLCALYSLDPDRNPEATQVMGSVLMEEMLHLALAANLLNAVGGAPRLDSAELLPAYPHPLPHADGAIQLRLGPFGPDALELFLAIETPAAPDAAPEGDRYQTISQFYAAIEDGLRGLCAELGEAAVFTGSLERQISDVHLRGGGGRMIVVQDLDSALAALDEIVEQGEGSGRADVWDGDRDVFHPERDEVAHYYRFLELREGRRFKRGDTPQTGPTGESIVLDRAGILPVRPNPRPSDFPADSPISVARTEFNRTYSNLLRRLEATFNCSPTALGDAIGVMYTLRAQAIQLMQMPTGDGRTTAGPTFEYLPPEQL
jgi:hypothetical protein